MATDPGPTARPLHDFNRLTENVFLYTPPANAQKKPDMLIVLCTWMGASPKHIVKYTLGHMRLFPSARILLIVNFLSDFFRSKAEYQRRLEPAVEVIRGQCNKSLYQKPTILIHSFSNGGANQLVQLATLFEEREGIPIPAQAIMFDSAPGKPSYWGSYAAMILSFPKNLFFRIIGPPVLHLLLISLGLYSTVLGGENMLNAIRRKLNDRNLLNQAARRLYLYSEADAMVRFKDVEEHGDDAEAAGLKVARVKFIKSPHAAHLMEDEEKYWNAVKDTWASSERKA